MEPGPLALLLSENDSAFVEGRLASLSLPYCGRRDTRTHALGSENQDASFGAAARLFALVFVMIVIHARPRS